MGSLTVSVLGPLQVTLDGAPLTDFKYNKVRALLAYLAVEAGRPHTRAHLCDLLWPELPESTARRNLTQALSALRRALGGAEAATSWLLATSEAVQLNAEAALDVDARRFAELLNASERHPHRLWRTCTLCAGRLREAMTLYRGDFLSQLLVGDSVQFEEWALLWREQLRQRALTALERLARRAEWTGNFGEAVAFTRRQVEIDSLREVGHRDLMRLLALDGQDSAAEAQYEHLRRMLTVELGVEPDEATSAVYAQIRAGHLEALRRYAARTFNGPAAPNRLIGREHEVAAVCGQLRDEAVRVLTIIGTPGLGKTRLALAAAHDLQCEYEDGVHFVELAPVADVSLVAPAIAMALGVKQRPGQTAVAALTAYLKTQHLLLVLDNFEHVLDAAGLVADLLAAAPAAKALITSRAPLRIRAEHQFPLTPLPEEAAVTLFGERVRAARPDFALTAEVAAEVAALCAQVDHLPLAIELIAVRARAFSLAELRQQLERPLEALAHGARDLPDRHRTVRNAIRWTYDRLSATEQHVFAHLSVFSGGATAEAAQAVAGAEPPVVLALEALVEASLATPHGAAGETRFSLLEVICEFAREQLDRCCETDAAQRQHAEFFTGLVERAQPELTGPEQAGWFERLDRELPNLRAALRWCVTNARALGLRLAAALEDYWNVRGRMAEGRRWFGELLNQEVPVAPAVQSEALRVAAVLAIRQGEARAASELAEQSRSLFVQLDDKRGLSASLNVLGEAAVLQSDFATAQSLFEQSLAYAREAQDDYCEAGALKGLAEVAQRSGDHATARTYVEQRLAIYRAQNDPRNTAGMLHNLGVLAYEQCDFEAARTYGEASLKAQRELDDKYGLALSLLHLGNTLYAQGDLAGAQAHLEESLAIHRRQHDGEPMSAPLNVLGKVLLSRGNVPGARACSSESLRLRFEVGDRRGVAVTLRSLAAVDHASGQSERAAQLLGTSDAIRESIRAPIPPNARAEHEQFVEALRAALGASAFQAALEAGRALTLEEAVALALT